jgi:hypothetical protein
MLLIFQLCVIPFNLHTHQSIGYMQLPDNFQDIYKGIFGEASTSEIYTHCKRELIHAIWELLLDEDFMHAYEHGIVICCGDGVTRRVFPRFFSYSADYPEKFVPCWLLNTILIFPTGFFWQTSSSLASVHALGVLSRRPTFRRWE